MKHIKYFLAVCLCCSFWAPAVSANPMPDIIYIYCHQMPGTQDVELALRCDSPFYKNSAKSYDCQGSYPYISLIRTGANGETRDLGLEERDEYEMIVDGNVAPGPYKYSYNLGYDQDHYNSYECIIVVLPAEDTVPANATAKETASPETAQHAGPVYFVAEKVYVDVTADTMAVKGVYTFENTSDKIQRQAISYPMPYKGFAKPATDVTVSGAQAVKMDKDSAHFIIEVPAKKRLTVTVQYHHTLTGSKARYLLTTAAGWGRPLESAMIEVSIPETLEDATLSIPATKTAKKDGKVIRRINKTKVLWKQDLDITLPAKAAQ